MILLLPDTVADPAVYILSGSTPVEFTVYKRALTKYGNICRLDDKATENQLTRKALIVKGDNVSSGFVEVQKLLTRYGLPPAWEILNDPPSRYR